MGKRSCSGNMKRGCKKKPTPKRPKPKPTPKGGTKYA